MARILYTKRLLSKEQVQMYLALCTLRTAQLAWCADEGRRLEVRQTFVLQKKQKEKWGPGGKVKVKFTLEQAMKDQKGSRDIALLFL
jgi:hypothetical protein